MKQVTDEHGADWLQLGPTDVHEMLRHAAELATGRAVIEYGDYTVSDQISVAGAPAISRVSVRFRLDKSQVPKHELEYWHREHGRCLVMTSHPLDGACLICESAKGDEMYFFTCERSDLELLPDQKWPYLGHQEAA